MAVAYEFTNNPDQHWSDVIEQITLSVEAQHLKLGEHGEELARTLLSFARDKAFANRKENPIVGYQLRGTLGSTGGPAVRLESISGDVFFRKRK